MKDPSMMTEKDFFILRNKGSWISKGKILHFVQNDRIKTFLFPIIHQYLQYETFLVNHENTRSSCTGEVWLSYGLLSLRDWGLPLPMLIRHVNIVHSKMVGTGGFNTGALQFQPIRQTRP